MERRLLAVSVFTVVLVTGQSLPVPPQIVAINSQELLRGVEDTRPEEVLETSLLEYYDDSLVSPSECEEHCSLTFPTHTYPVVENHLACRQGCILVQLGASQDNCKLECSSLYITEDERFACGMGCDRPVPSDQPQRHTGKVIRTIVTVNSVQTTTSLGFSLFSLKEKLKHFFWRSEKENSFHRESLQLEDGQHLFLSGHSVAYNEMSMKELLAPQIAALMVQDHDLSSSTQLSLVYMSKAVVHTMHHRTFLNKLVLYGVVLLILIDVLLLIVSIIADWLLAAKKAIKNEEQSVPTFKLPPCAHECHDTHAPKDQQTELVSKLPTYEISPVTVILDSKH